MEIRIMSITIYTRNNCVQCHKAGDEAVVEFEMVNVDLVPDAADAPSAGFVSTGSDGRRFELVAPADMINRRTQLYAVNCMKRLLVYFSSSSKIRTVYAAWGHCTHVPAQRERIQVNGLRCI